jgi:hypothetical protein
MEDGSWLFPLIRALISVSEIAAAAAPGAIRCHHFIEQTFTQSTVGNAHAL